MLGIFCFKALITQNSQLKMNNKAIEQRDEQQDQIYMDSVMQVAFEIASSITTTEEADKIKFALDNREKIYKQRELINLIR